MTRRHKKHSKANGKQRFQLVFDEATAKQAETLAGQDLRSLNNLMGWLVTQEFKRRLPKAA